MVLIPISNQSVKNLSKKSTIRFTQSICPDCNMILDAEVFERDKLCFPIPLYMFTLKTDHQFNPDSSLVV